MRNIRGLTVAAVVVANVLVLALAIQSLQQSRMQYEARARTQVQNVAVAIDLTVSHTIDKIDLVLRNTVAELEHHLAAGRINEERMDDFLRLQEMWVPAIEAVRVARADGLVILGKGLNKAERISWADRDYFLQLSEHADAGLIMSPPRLGRVAKKYIVGFARRFNGPDGRFAGVVSAPVALDHFSQLLANFDLGTNGTVILRDGNLGLITRHPAIPGAAAGAVGSSSVSREFRELIASNILEASYYTAAGADGFERIASFRRLKQVPVYVIAGMASDDYLAAWRKEVLATSGLALAFVLLSSVSSTFLIKLLGRMQRELAERRRLEATERRRRSSHQRLNEVAALSHLPLNEQLHQALLVGAEHLGLEIGIVSHITDGQYRIVAHAAPAGTLHDGDTYPLGDTYCSMVVESGEVIAISEMGASPRKGHPCYVAFGLEAYIGAPLRVADLPFGTISFSSPRRYEREFDEGDREFVGLLARWAGAAIERDEARARLAMSERSLQTIVETEPECVKVVAPDGTVARMNRAGLDMVEAERPEQVIGHPVMGLIAPEWREEFQALHRRVISGEACTLEFEIVGLKGGHRWLETHAVPLRDTNGQVSGHLAVTRDVTQRRQTEDALREATRKAEAANIAKSRFLATMSHEIRTPLNGILGMAQLLLVPGLREDEREDCVRTILGSGQTLLTLLNDILDLSKVDAGKLSLSSEAFSPAELIEATIALHGEAAESHGISLTGTWGGPATQWYRGDPVRIRQMLSNLVSNAIKFTDAGSVRVEGREASRSEGKATLVFEVADTGIGIPEDQRNQLFQPFTQLDGTATRRHGGTGLGLSIVRRLAEMMGGSVGVESIEGQGSTFRFSILIDLADVATPVPTDDVANPGVAPSIPSARILVVEDNDTNRLVVETYLRKHGYTVLSATDGRAALDLVSGGTRPHLILMDCQMPVMDGFAATEAIRAWENETGSPRLPIVALTAGAFQEDRQRCMACGMDDFLTKPITFATLEAMLIKWLPPA